jgi:hypothetical protein
MVHETDQKIAECIGDLDSLRQLRNVSVKGLSEHITEIQQGFTLVTKEVKMMNAYKEYPLYSRELDGTFVHKVEDFYEKVSSKVSYLDKEFKGLEKDIKNVFNFFGEPETSKMTPETLIGYIVKFLNSFEV